MKLIKFILLLLIIINFSLTKTFSSENKILIDKISKNLRCLICQGQSVYDSQSEFALSMKLLIKKKLKEGSSEKEIYDFLKKSIKKEFTFVDNLRPLNERLKCPKGKLCGKVSFIFLFSISLLTNNWSKKL